VSLSLRIKGFYPWGATIAMEANSRLRAEAINSFAGKRARFYKG